MSDFDSFERDGWSSGRSALHPSVSFTRADAAALPFEDGSFDAVVSNFLMPHVSDLPAVAMDLARVAARPPPTSSPAHGAKLERWRSGDGRRRLRGKAGSGDTKLTHPRVDP